MLPLERRDIFWKTISVIIIILLSVLGIFGSCLLASDCFVNNVFTDHSHPTEIKWDINKIKSGDKPQVILKFESHDIALEKFYNAFQVPPSWRFDPAIWQIIILISIIGVIYMVGIILVVNDDGLDGYILFWTTLISQLILFFALIICTFVYYQGPDLSVVSDQQLIDKAGDQLRADLLLPIILLLVSFIIFDFVVTLISCCTIDFLKETAKKIKAVIINKLTLGNNIMLCCNNGRFELISIDFELRWIPFPALFLKKRVLDSFLAQDASPRRLREWLGELSLSIEEEQIRQFSQLNMNGGSLLISHDDSVQIIRLNSALQWRPFPQTVVQQEVRKQITFDNFFRYLMADSKQIALEELKGLLTGSYKDRFTTAGRTAVLALTKSVCAKTLELLKKSLPKITADQSNLAGQRAVQLLQELTDEKLRAFQQEIIASIQESLEGRISQNIRENILRPLREVLSEQMPLVNSNGSIDALPDGTKFFFTHGRYKLVIVEQKPQLRSLQFQDDFRGGSGRYNLALPYIIFLIIFEDNNFSRMYAYYANKPLTSLDGEVFRSNLPNIDSDNKVCTGFRGCRANTLTGRVNEVIAHFYQSDFNNDLRSGYDHMSERGGVFKNLATWQKASQKLG